MPSVALLARGDTALLATKFWQVDYSTAGARGARQALADRIQDTGALHRVEIYCLYPVPCCLLLHTDHNPRQRRVRGHAIGLIHICSARRSRHGAMVAVAIQRNHVHQALLDWDT